MLLVLLLLWKLSCCYNSCYYCRPRICVAVAAAASDDPERAKNPGIQGKVQRAQQQCPREVAADIGGPATGVMPSEAEVGH